MRKNEYRSLSFCALGVLYESSSPILYASKDEEKVVVAPQGTIKYLKMESSLGKNIELRVPHGLHNTDQPIRTGHYFLNAEKSS